MTTNQSEYSTEQLLDAIALAVKDRAFDAVAALLRRLAVQDPHVAQAVLDTVAAATTAASSFEHAMAAAHRAVNATGEQIAALDEAAREVAALDEDSAPTCRCSVRAGSRGPHAAWCAAWCRA